MWAVLWVATATDLHRPWPWVGYNNIVLLLETKEWYSARTGVVLCQAYTLHIAPSWFSAPVARPTFGFFKALCNVIYMRLFALTMTIIGSQLSNGCKHHSSVLSRNCSQGQTCGNMIMAKWPNSQLNKLKLLVIVVLLSVKPPYS